jgi:predicted regulator of Ras-like GTPase activity (Roadblock/LC7/MglB family)
VTVSVHNQASQFDWLLAGFVHGTDGVRDAVAVSADGLLIAASEGLDRAGADRLAAMVSGMSSLARSASREYGFDGLKLIMIEMARGFLLVSAFSGGGCLGVLAEAGADLGLVGYEITVLVDRVGHLLTPALVNQARQAWTR